MKLHSTIGQTPLFTGFGATSTANDVLKKTNLSANIAIVTGGHSGLGLETTRALARAGAKVVVAARVPDRAREVLEDLPDVEVDELDLMDPHSIDSFAARFLHRFESLPILINSAGIMATPLEYDSRGNESQFSTNHLGHFQLTLRLWPALLRAQGARVVSVSSRGHQIAGVDFDDINFLRRTYDKWVAYGQSKTANALFAVALDARGRLAGIRAFSVHPGSVLGPLARHLSAEEIATFGVHDEFGNVIVAPERDLKTAAQGAATAVWCATSSRLDGLGGLYCEDCNIARIATPSSPERGGVMPWAIDPEIAEQLWHLSERMSGTSLA